MLRVGLTGGLGSGKSTVGAMFRSLGAQVIDADAIGRELMQPGQQVYREIVARFGPEVVRQPDGQLDRALLAQLAFQEGRLGELNAIVHPAVFAVQAEWSKRLEAAEPDAIAVVESALVFESASDPRERFDRIVLVTAPESLKISRFVERASQGRALAAAERSALEADAMRRIAAQLPDAAKIPLCDFVIENSGDLANVEVAAAQVYGELRGDAK